MNINISIILLLCLHISAQCMDIVPVQQSTWHLLVPEILFNIVENLDLYSCESLRKSCKNYHAMKSVYYGEKLNQPKIIQRLRDLAPHMDVDIYTQNMVFLVHHDANMCARSLFHNTNEKNRAESSMIWYSMLSYHKGYSLLDSIPFLYDKKRLETMFDVLMCVKKRDHDYRKEGLHKDGLHIVRLILAHTEDINYQNKEGNTLLHCAKSREQYEYLLSHTAIDVNIKNNKGETPLCYVIQHPRFVPYNGSLHIGGAGISEWIQAKMLLEDQKTDLLVATNEGKTAIHYAAQCASNEKKGTVGGHWFYKTKITGFFILQKLAEKLNKKNLVAVDNNGKTALHLAAQHGYVEAIEFLFSAFPKEAILLKDNEGKIFLNYMHEEAVIRVLLLSKKINEKDSDKKLICTAATGQDVTKVIEQDDSDEDLQLFYKYKEALVVGSLVSLMIGVAAYFFMTSE